MPAEMQPYIACLKKNGVTLPANGRVFGNRNGQGGQSEASASQAPPSLALGAPQTSVQGQVPAQAGGGNGGAPPSFDRQKFQAAQQACASLLPEGAQPFGGFGGGGNGGANASAFNAYRSCMADHGVTLPNRQNGQGGESGSAPVSIDRNSSTFQAANDVCKALLPNGGQGFGGGPGGAPQGNGAPQGSTPTTSS